MNVRRFEMMKDLLLDISDMRVVDDEYHEKDPVLPSWLFWLEKLWYSLLSALPPRQFTMSFWHYRSSACAIGHAALRKNFQREGLYLDEDDVPSYRGLQHYDAIAEFFGIKMEEAAFLFCKAYYPEGATTPLDIYMRVCDFIRWTPEEREKNFLEASMLRYGRR